MNFNSSNTAFPSLVEKKTENKRFKDRITINIIAPR